MSDGEDTPQQRGEHRPAWRGNEDIGPIIGWLLQFADESSRDRAGIREELTGVRREVTAMKESQLTRRDMRDTLDEWAASSFDTRVQAFIDRRTSAYVWKALAGISLTLTGALLVALIVERL